MPRLSPSLLRQAFAQSNSIHVLLLFRATRDLNLAKNELRWLTEYVLRIRQLKLLDVRNRYRLKEVPSLPALVRLRAIGFPLQYILGSQPFCELEILCRKGVLIPRPETETYTIRLSNLLLRWFRGLSLLHERDLAKQTPPLRVLDLCAGTGCIGLGLLSNLLHAGFPTVQVRAIDISPRARDLALKTVRLNQQLGRLPRLLIQRRQYEYRLADVLAFEHKDQDHLKQNQAALQDEVFDIVVSNPPYISLSSYSKDTSRSARRFEPKSALVPERLSSATSPSSLTKVSRAINRKDEDLTGDVFYHRILRIATTQQANLVLVEVADLEQAWRVIDIVNSLDHVASNGQSTQQWAVKQIWCDEIDIHGLDQDSTNTIDEKAPGRVDVIGTGQGRAVVLARNWAVRVVSEPSR